MPNELLEAKRRVNNLVAIVKGVIPMSEDQMMRLERTLFTQEMDSGFTLVNYNGNPPLMGDTLYPLTDIANTYKIALGAQKREYWIKCLRTQIEWKTYPHLIQTKTNTVYIPSHIENRIRMRTIGKLGMERGRIILLGDGESKLTTCNGGAQFLGVSLKRFKEASQSLGIPFEEKIIEGEIIPVRSIGYTFEVLEEWRERVYNHLVDKYLRALDSD